MIVIALLLVSVTAGVCGWLAARAALRRWWGQAPAAPVAEKVREHGRVRRFVHSRLDAEVITGLALTLALFAFVVAGLAVALLALAVRRSELLADIDAAAARWAQHHTTELTHRMVEAVTNLASTPAVIVIGVIVAVIEWLRVRNPWVPVFLLVVTLGDTLVTSTIKELIDRARPTIDPVAATLGPSFPSGHSSTAAAFYAALALLAGRRRSASAKAVLVGVAVGIAAAVASSRVLLDLHWVSDVIAGLALGWGWFAVCTIAFGGWMLKLGAPVEQAAAAAPAQPPVETLRS
jgi:membrane-associated phospholipid phosphatase